MASTSYTVNLVLPGPSGAEVIRAVFSSRSGEDASLVGARAAAFVQQLAASSLDDTDPRVALVIRGPFDDNPPT